MRMFKYPQDSNLLSTSMRHTADTSTLHNQNEIRKANACLSVHIKYTYNVKVNKKKLRIWVIKWVMI